MSDKKIDGIKKIKKKDITESRKIVLESIDEELKKQRSLSPVAKKLSKKIDGIFSVKISDSETSSTDQQEGWQRAVNDVKSQDLRKNIKPVVDSVNKKPFKGASVKSNIKPEIKLPEEDCGIRLDKGKRQAWKKEIEEVINDEGAAVKVDGLSSSGTIAKVKEAEDIEKTKSEAVQDKESFFDKFKKDLDIKRKQRIAKKDVLLKKKLKEAEKRRVEKNEKLSQLAVEKDKKQQLKNELKRKRELKKEQLAKKAELLKKDLERKEKQQKLEEQLRKDKLQDDLKQKELESKKQAEENKKLAEQNKAKQEEEKIEKENQKKLKRLKKLNKKEARLRKREEDRELRKKQKEEELLQRVDEKKKHEAEKIKKKEQLREARAKETADREKQELRDREERAMKEKALLLLKEKEKQVAERRKKEKDRKKHEEKRQALILAKEKSRRRSKRRSEMFLNLNSFVKDVSRTGQEKLLYISGKVLSLISIFVLIFLFVYFLFILVVLRFKVDNPLSRSLAEYVFIPAFISHDGAVEYYNYKDYKLKIIKNEEIDNVQADVSAKLLFSREFIFRKLLESYNLPVLNYSDLDDDSRRLINQSLLMDIAVNQVPLNRVRKIKDLIVDANNFARVATKYGDETGSIIINSQNKDKFSYYDSVRLLNKGEISKIILTDGGYYIFRVYETKEDYLELNYVHVLGETLEEYLQKEIEGYKLWSFID